MKTRKEFAPLHPRTSPPPTPAAVNSAPIVVEPHGELTNRVVSILDQARAYAQRSPEIRHKPRDELNGLDQENATAATTGGRIAKRARQELENKTGKPVVSGESYLPPPNNSRLNKK